MILWTHWWKTLPFKWSLTFTIFSIKDLNYNMKNSSDNQCNKVGNLPIPEFICTVCISYQPSVFLVRKIEIRWQVDSTDINCWACVPSCLDLDCLTFFEVPIFWVIFLLMPNKPNGRIHVPKCGLVSNCI